MLELGDRLVGGERGDARHRHDAVAVRAIRLGGVHVERPRQRRPQLVVGEMDRGEPVRRVGDRNVDADLIEALVEELRQHRGRAVERVARRYPPPRHAHERHLAALCGRERLGEAAARDDHVEPFGDRRAGDLDEDVAHERQVLDDVAVAVDDRVVDPLANPGDVVAQFVLRHAVSIAADAKRPPRRAAVRRYRVVRLRTSTRYPAPA